LSLKDTLVSTASQEKAQNEFHMEISNNVPIFCFMLGDAQQFPNWVLTAIPYAGYYWVILNETRSSEIRMPTGLSRWQCHIHSQSSGTTKGPSTTAASVCLARRGSQQALYLAQQQNQCVKVSAAEDKLVNFRNNS
jgi:hypothetical protein